MPLPSILGPAPGASGWEKFVFDHYEDHLEILQAIQAQNHVKLTLYNILQFNSKDPETYLSQHQQFHDDMNQALGLTGQDLSAVDFKKKDEVDQWVYLNFNEHLAARSQLKI